MDIRWIEVYGESRDFTVTRKSVSKIMTFIVTSEDFLDNADTQLIPGTDTLLYFDDSEMQKEILPAFTGVVPIVYQFWIDPSTYIWLYVQEVSAKQLNFKQWKITVTFDVPEDNGQNNGGGGGDTGPSAGEKNSDEFTQISFNSEVKFEKKQTAFLAEIQEYYGGPGLASLYTVGQPCFIGISDEGIEGYEQPVRSFTFEITQYLSPKFLTYEYCRKLARCAACLNSKPFFGFAPLSVMCMGAGASGHLFQNVPVTLQFEVRTNFKFKQSGTSKLAPIDDVYIYNADGSREVDYSTQYDTYAEPRFPDSAVTNSLLAPGVHSGWSIVEYQYAAQVKSDSKRVVKLPTHRLVFIPEDMLAVDFNEFVF